MMTKLTVSLATIGLLLSLAAWGPAILPLTETAFAQEAIQAEPAQPAPHTPELMRVLFEEMTLVWLQSETYAHAITACAGTGLNNIQPLDSGTMVLIPNAGDLSVDGSNVAIKYNHDGEITFIPRTTEQRIRVPIDVGNKVAGQEVLSLSLDEAAQLMAAGKLSWTAQDHGPFGNGYGLAGHIAECDLRYVEPD